MYVSDCTPFERNEPTENSDLSYQIPIQYEGKEFKSFVSK